MAHPMGESTREGRRVEREPPNDRDRRENDGEHQPETTVALTNTVHPWVPLLAPDPPLGSGPTRSVVAANGSHGVISTKNPLALQIRLFGPTRSLSPINPFAVFLRTTAAENWNREETGVSQSRFGGGHMEINEHMRLETSSLPRPRIL